MKRTRATLSPVKRRKIDARDNPITAANTQKSAWAVLACIRSIPKLINSTKPSGASITRKINGVCASDAYNPVDAAR